LKKNFKISGGGLTSGDLVKIKSSTWAGRARDAFGLLMEDIHGDADLFPRAVVYNMEHRQIKLYYLYDLELISSAT